MAPPLGDDGEGRRSRVGDAGMVVVGISAEDGDPRAEDDDAPVAEDRELRDPADDE